METEKKVKENKLSELYYSTVKLCCFVVIGMSIQIVEKETEITCVPDTPVAKIKDEEWIAATPQKHHIKSIAFDFDSKCTCVCMCLKHV